MYMLSRILVHYGLHLDTINTHEEQTRQLIDVLPIEVYKSSAHIWQETGITDLTQIVDTTGQYLVPFQALRPSHRRIKKTPIWYQNIQIALTGKSTVYGNTILKLHGHLSQTADATRPYRCNQTFQKLRLSPEEPSFHLNYPQNGPPRNVKIWTDGGLDPRTKIMTAAVYIPELYVERAYRLPSIDPSSTRAEIFAIAAALSELTPHSRATIHSDSQAAIAAITAIMTITSWTYTRFHRIKNSAILQYIWATLRQFNVAIELKWVRGHSDSKENNRADWLATSAYTLHTVTDIPPGNVSCLMHDGTRSEMPTKSILGLLQHGKTNFDLMNTSAISRVMSAHGDIQLKASWVATVIGQGKSGPLDASHVAEIAFRIKEKLGILKPPKADTCHQCDGPYTPNHMLTC
jgi:ribonuclease HI